MNSITTIELKLIELSLIFDSVFIGNWRQIGGMEHIKSDVNHIKSKIGIINNTLTHSIECGLREPMQIVAAVLLMQVADGHYTKADF